MKLCWHILPYRVQDISLKGFLVDFRFLQRTLLGINKQLELTEYSRYHRSQRCSQSLLESDNFQSCPLGLKSGKLSGKVDHQIWPFEQLWGTRECELWPFVVSHREFLLIFRWRALGFCAIPYSSWCFPCLGHAPCSHLLLMQVFLLYFFGRY